MRRPCNTRLTHDRPATSPVWLGSWLALIQRGRSRPQTKNKTPAGSARIFVRSQAAAILPGCELPGFASLRQGSALPGSDARSAFAFTQTSHGRLRSKLKFKGRRSRP
jgi:hypothetical protein